MTTTRSDKSHVFLSFPFNQAIHDRLFPVTSIHQQRQISFDDGTNQITRQFGLRDGKAMAASSIKLFEIFSIYTTFLSYIWKMIRRIGGATTVKKKKSEKKERNVCLRFSGRTYEKSKNNLIVWNDPTFVGGWKWIGIAAVMGRRHWGGDLMLLAGRINRWHTGRRGWWHAWALHLLLELNGQRRRCRHVGRCNSLVDRFVENDGPTGHVKKFSFQLPGRWPDAQFRFGRPQFQPASVTVLLVRRHGRFHDVARFYFVDRLKYISIQIWDKCIFYYGSFSFFFLTSTIVFNIFCFLLCGKAHQFA